MRLRLFPCHRRRLTGLLAAALLAGGALASPTAAAQADPGLDVPPQEPGVTLRVFDLQTQLSKLCTLKPAQTPNSDKLMPTIDWSSTEDFGGIADYFLSETTANLVVPRDGSYEFRLSSDDGSQLRIDGQLVVDHDGMYGADPKFGAVDLTAGLHPLRIDHFDRDGDQRLSLGWKPPGANDYATVPREALSTDAGVTRVTSPGRKECDTGADSPGDGLPLTSVRPDLTLTDLRPEGFKPQVTGMDWLPDGRLAVSTWGGSLEQAGEVYLLDHTVGSTGPDKVTAKKVAGGLKEPMGLKVVDGTIFVTQKHELTELVDTDGNDVVDQYKTVATWPFHNNYHEFAFGLLYRDGYFYLNLSVAIDYGGATTNPQPSVNRGTSLKVNRKTGKVSYVAGGLRTPNGIGWGPGGDAFVTDNQGGWLPASKLVQIKQGRFFNAYTNPTGPFDGKPVTKPVLYLPHHEIANSPSTPLYLTKGRFAGQMLFGDVTYGGIQRAYLDKVDGQYQGAVFRFTQGLEAGINRMVMGPDGAIYVGGLGAEGNWGQIGKLRYGLQKLAPNGGNTFDILAMRAKPGGFELEYTQPISQQTADKLANHYQAAQWHYTATSAYGGPKIAEETLKVSAATLSADRKKVRLTIDGLKPDRVVYLRSPRPFSSTSGETLWSTEAWYTLNSMPGKQPPRATLYEAEEATLTGTAGVNTNHTGYSGSAFVDGYGDPGAATTFEVDVAKAGTYDVGLRYSNGPNPFDGTKALTLSVNGRKVKQTTLLKTGNWETWSTQYEALRLHAGKNTITYKHEPGDQGVVNLDLITVHPHGAPLTLFDGTPAALSQWQHSDGRAVQWPVADGAMEVCCGDIRTKQSYTDFQLHVEFRVPDLPPDVTGQARGNSGVYLQARYEVQVLDSYGDTTLADNEAGAIYSKKAPDVNAATAPETWQTYDITFHAARYDAAGTKTADARVTVVWNGQTVHNDVAIDGPTVNGVPEGPAAGALLLQDHGNKVRYRNIRIQPLA